MKKLLAATIPVAVLAFAPAAMASTPTRAHVRQYLRAYTSVRRKFGRRTPGCNLVAHRGSCHKRASDGDVEASLAVLQRMLEPVVSVRYVAPLAPRMTATVGRTVVTHGTLATTAVPASGYAACIIQAESGGNPQAVNGRYMGIGQWEQSRWLSDGGGRYAPTPLGATYSQQVAILNGEGAAGMHQQQGQYDHCG